MAILYGTQSNGETLPVLVDQFGNLLAKGIEGATGPIGPEGPPGIGQLPPDPFEGAILGWEDGKLSWVGGFVPLPAGTYGPFTYIKDSGKLVLPQDVSELINGQQLFMSDSVGNKVIKEVETDTISTVSSDGFITLTFPSPKDFDFFEVGEMVQSPVWNQGQEWTNKATVTNNNDQTSGLNRTFDGDPGTGSSMKVSGTTPVWTFGPGTGLTPTTIDVQTYGGGEVKINTTGNKSTPVVTSLSKEVSLFSYELTGTFVSITFSPKNNGNNSGIKQILFDGIPLVDASIDPSTSPDAAIITSIDTSGPRITMTGGRWLGADGSGRPDGQTTISKQMSGKGSVYVAHAGDIILREDNKEWVDGFYVTAPAQVIAARKVALNARKLRKQ